MNGRDKISIETFRPIDDGDRTVSRRPLDSPSGSDKSVNIGKGSPVQKPKTPAPDKPKSGQR